MAVQPSPSFLSPPPSSSHSCLEERNGWAKLPSSSSDVKVLGGQARRAAPGRGGSPPPAAGDKLPFGR